MHIPDGFLSAGVAGASWAAAAAGAGYSVRRAGQDLKEKTIPLMGIMAAFIFTAQMLNFPVGAGTSGHLLGGVLAAVLLGPFAGAAVLTCVLIIQALVFNDGGLFTLGANILNMAVFGTMAGYMVYRLLLFLTGKRTLSAGIAGWFSVVGAASLCATELAASGTAPARFVFPAMAGVHALIGIGEGIITAAVVGFVLRARPDLLYGAFEREPDARGRRKVFVAAAATILAFVVCAPFASRFPDGLEKVAGGFGFLNREAPARAAPLANYVWPGVPGERAAALLAALAGIALVVCLVFVLLRLTRLRRKPPPRGRNAS